MALQQQTNQKNKAISYQGPSMQSDGLPPNPSDEIFMGRPLPIRPAQAQTIRRPFASSEVLKNPLHYSEGQGTDEVLPRPTMPEARTVDTPPEWIGKKSNHTDGNTPVPSGYGY